MFHSTITAKRKKKNLRNYNRINGAKYNKHTVFPIPEKFL